MGLSDLLLDDNDKQPDFSSLVSGRGASKFSSDDAASLIEKYESGGRNILQQLVSPRISSASGYYQITDSTWKDIAPKVGIDTSQYPTAMSAPREIQRKAEEQLYNDRGFAPWSSNKALMKAVGSGSTYAAPKQGLVAKILADYESDQQAAYKERTEQGQRVTQTYQESLLAQQQQDNLQEAQAAQQTQQQVIPGMTFDLPRNTGTSLSGLPLPAEPYPGAFANTNRQRDADAMRKNPHFYEETEDNSPERKQLTAQIESEFLQQKALGSLKAGNILQAGLQAIDAQRARLAGSDNEGMAGFLGGVEKGIVPVLKGALTLGQLTNAEGAAEVAATKGQSLKSALDLNPEQEIRQQTGMEKVGEEAGGLVTSLAKLWGVGKIAPALSAGAQFVLSSAPDKAVNIGQTIADGGDVREAVQKAIIETGVDYATGNILGPAAEEGAEALQAFPRIGAGVAQGAVFAGGNLAEQALENNGAPIDPIQVAKQAAMGIGFGLLHKVPTNAELHDAVASTPVPSLIADMHDLPLTEEMLAPVKASGAVSEAVTTENIDPGLARGVKEGAIAESIVRGLKETGNFHDAVIHAGGDLDIPQETIDRILSHPDIQNYVREPDTAAPAEDRAAEPITGDRGPESAVSEQSAPPKGENPIVAGPDAAREVAGATDDVRSLATIIDNAGQNTELPHFDLGDDRGAQAEEANQEISPIQPGNDDSHTEQAPQAELPVRSGLRSTQETIAWQDAHPDFPLNNGSSAKDIRDYAIRNRIKVSDENGNKLGFGTILDKIRDAVDAKESAAPAKIGEAIPPAQKTVESPVEYSKALKPEEANAIADAHASLPPNEQKFTEDTPPNTAKSWLLNGLLGRKDAEAFQVKSDMKEGQKEQQQFTRMSQRENMAQMRFDDARFRTAANNMRKIAFAIREKPYDPATGERTPQMVFADFLERNPKSPTTAKDVIAQMEPNAVQFITKGKIQNSAKLEADLNALRDVSDKTFAERWKQVVSSAKRPEDLAEKYIQYYMPHIFVDPRLGSKVMQQYTGKYQAEGNKNFLRERKIPYISDALRSGLKLAHDNMVDTMLAGNYQEAKYAMAHRWWNTMRNAGLPVFTRSMKSPLGYGRVDDKIGIVFGNPKVPIITTFDEGVRNGLESWAKNNNVDIKYALNPQELPPEAGAGIKHGDISDRIFMRYGTDNERLTHEVGHAIDNKLDLYRKLTAIDPGGKIKQQLQDLADKRIVGHEDAPDSFTSYIRSQKEAVPNLIHAYVHAPDLLNEIAPDAKAKLEQIAKNAPKLSDLLQIKPSLVQGTRTDTPYIGGTVIQGYWHLPQKVAADFNNSLTPGLEQYKWYKAGRFINNTLNAASLSLSGFHGMGTALNAAVSSYANGFERLAMGKGGAEKAIGAMRIVEGATVLPAVVRALAKGKQIRNAAMADGADPKLQGYIQDIIKAGGDVTMNPKYASQFSDNFTRMLTREPSLKAITKGLSSEAMHILTWSGRQIMERWVPSLKIGVMADAIDAINGRNITDPAEYQRQLQEHWRSIDNRFGQLIYDNLFWNKTAKDLAMLSVRSVGWNYGTVNELGGGLMDFGQQGLNLLKLQKPTLTSRMAYTAALPVAVGMWGAVANYIMAGEDPKSLLDYYFPRTGRKTPEGDDERFSLPTYMNDVVSFAHNLPGSATKTVVNKLGPFLNTIGGMLQNKTYWGEEITDPNSPLSEQIADYGKFFLSQGKPFSAQGAAKELERGHSLLSPEVIAPFMGFKPATKEMLRSKFENWSHDLQQRKKGTASPEEALVSKQRSEVRQALQQSKEYGDQAYNTAKELAKTHGISPQSFAQFYNEGSLSKEERYSKSLSAKELSSGIKEMTDEEKQKYLPILEEKISNSKSLSEEEKQTMRKEYNLETPVPTPRQKHNQIKKESYGKRNGAGDEYDKEVLWKTRND